MKVFKSLLFFLLLSFPIYTMQKRNSQDRSSIPRETTEEIIDVIEIIEEYQYEQEGIEIPGHELEEIETRTNQCLPMLAKITIGIARLAAIIVAAIVKVVL